MMTTVRDNLQFFIRWLHVIAGITWIGHLYFFNFVNANVQPKLDGPTKKAVNPHLMMRALFFFRWGAMITFLAGLYLLVDVYFNLFEGGGAFWNADGTLATRAWWIMIGATAGIIMWFNVWFVIWPRQKIIQAGTRDGTKVDPQLAKTAGNASKLNTYLSGPMLFGMLAAPGHYAAFSWYTGAGAIVLGLLAIWFVFKGAPKAAADFPTAAAAPAPAPAAPPADAKK
jgi:uncharacterized membrane protein